MLVHEDKVCQRNFYKQMINVGASRVYLNRVFYSQVFSIASIRCQGIFIASIFLYVQTIPVNICVFFIEQHHGINKFIKLL